MQTIEQSVTKPGRDVYRLIDQQAVDAAAAALLRAGGIGSTITGDSIREVREIASLFPDSGACTVATALKLWLWTSKHLGPEHADELADVATPLLAARALILESLTADKAALDLAHVYAAHASAQAGAACAELVYGHRKHLLWDAEGCATCYVADDLDELEAIMPGIAAGAGSTIDVINIDGSHPAKRGPCANSDGLEAFVRLRNRLDVCLTGARIAKDRLASGRAS